MRTVYRKVSTGRQVSRRPARRGAGSAGGTSVLLAKLAFASETLERSKPRRRA